MSELKQHPQSSPEVKIYLNTFTAFHAVVKTLFNEGVQQPNWWETLHQLRFLIHQLHTSCGLPITPKLHILTVHIEQWVDINGRALREEQLSSRGTLSQ